jgi:hypothetical protein
VATTTNKGRLEQEAGRWRVDPVYGTHLVEQTLGR